MLKPTLNQIIDILLLNAIQYKKGALIVLALPFSVVIDILYNGSFLGIGVGFILFFFVLIMVDLFTGIIAAKHEGETIMSAKILFTVYKIFFYMAFFLMVYLIKKELTRQDYWIYEQFIHGMNVVSLTVLVLLVLREYVSIGENFERRFGKKHEIFKLVDKIADIIENKLIKKIEDSEICDPKKDENKPKGN